MRQYRLIYDQPARGSRNMARDEAIMHAVTAGESAPTLRLYAWEPACLSLGYAQSWHDADTKRLAHYGWDLVRRPTGGRAILHTNELTYSLALPPAHPLAEGGIIASYHRISGALAAALESLGMVPMAQKQAEKIKDTGPVCFEATSHYEIATEDGRKLVGSAQLRRKGGLLQHGSLPLHGDVARICDALHYETEAQREQAKARVRVRAATLYDALGKVISWEYAANALAYGFAEVFDANLIEGNLSPDEEAHTLSLQNEVYGAAHYTRRR